MYTAAAIAAASIAERAQTPGWQARIEPYASPEEEMAARPDASATKFTLRNGEGVSRAPFDSRDLRVSYPFSRSRSAPRPRAVRAGRPEDRPVIQTFLNTVTGEQMQIVVPRKPEQGSPGRSPRRRPAGARALDPIRESLLAMRKRNAEYMEDMGKLDALIEQQRELQNKLSGIYAIRHGNYEKCQSVIHLKEKLLSVSREISLLMERLSR